MFMSYWGQNSYRKRSAISSKLAMQAGDDGVPDAPASCSQQLPTQPSNTDSAMQYSLDDSSANWQTFVWTSRLHSTTGKPAPASLPLNTPTSASAEYWQQHSSNSAIFNVGLVTEGHPGEPVPCAAVDLAAYSVWFQMLLDHLETLNGTDLGGVLVPCVIPRPALETLVGALYRGALPLDADNVEPLYRAADAMQMPHILEACEAYLYSTATATSSSTNSSSSATSSSPTGATSSAGAPHTSSSSPDSSNSSGSSSSSSAALPHAAAEAVHSSASNQSSSGPDWVCGVFDLAVDLQRRAFAEKLAIHYATLAQRAPGQYKELLLHMLSSELYRDDGRAQLKLLREGWEAAWAGQGSEVLLLNVVLEVAEVIAPQQIAQVLADSVCWDRLAPPEVLALVDWALGLPPGLPLAAPLKDAALRCISRQGYSISSHAVSASSATSAASAAAGRQYLVWAVDLGGLPSAPGQRLASSAALSVGRGRLYLSVERVNGTDWGLFLCPPPDVSLTSRVTHHTLFVLGHSFSHRVAFHDVTVDPNLRVGAGYGSRTIISEWVAAGFAKPVQDSSKWLTVGTVATGVVLKDHEELLDSWSGTAGRWRRATLQGNLRRR